MTNTLQIPDLSLREAIAEELNKAADDPINADEMAGLEELNVLEAGVIDLSGLEYAK